MAQEVSPAWMASKDVGARRGSPADCMATDSFTPELRGGTTENLGDEARQVDHGQDAFEQLGLGCGIRQLGDGYWSQLCWGESMYFPGRIDRNGHDAVRYGGNQGA